jgi:HPt (histidine-containing phosphotransfer) domain-containing protein
MGAAIADREQRLLAARKSLRDLFDHMRQAIIAFGPDGRIQGEASRKAVNLFGEQALKEKPVREVLYDRAAAYDVNALAFDEWVDIAFQTPESDWSDVERIAPTEVVLHPEGCASIPLELEFRPVSDGGRVDRIMLLMTDVSEQRKLARTVELREEEHARQIAAMRRLVAGGPQVFVTFVEGARKRIARCLEIVGPSQRLLPSAEIDELFRHAHTLKGEAKAFDLRDLESETAKLEEDLDELRSRARGQGFAATGSEHAALVAHFARATKALDQGCEVFVAASPNGRAALDQVTVQRSDLAELFARVGGRDDDLGRLAARLASRPFGEAAANLVDLVPTWAAREGKQARLQVEGREVRVQPELARVLGGVLTHLVRNAVVHGIEPPDVRQQRGKPAIGLIRLGAEERAEWPVFTIEDDGQGLDLELIARQAKAIGCNTPGGPTAELAFLPGLSTASRVGDLAGRGVGLSAVRAELSEVGYTSEVFSQGGSYAKFVLYRKEGGVMVAGKEAR